MITTSTLSAATDLFNSIEEKLEGAIVPIRGTSIEYISTYSMPIGSDDNTIDIVEASKSGIVEGESQHDTAFSSLLDAQVKSLIRVKQLTSTVVNPMIRELFEAISKAGEEEEHRLSQQWSVIPFRLPKFYSNGILNDFLNRYESTTPRQVRGVGVSMETQDEFIAAVTNGLSVFGDEVVQCAVEAIKGWELKSLESLNRRVWHLFESIRTLPPVEVLVVLGLSQEWISNPPKANMELSDFEANMSSALAESGRILFHVRRRHNEQLKTNTLIKNVDTFGKNIVVYAENYEKYIKQHNGTYESTVGFAVHHKGISLLEAAETVSNCERLYKNERVVANRKLSNDLDRVRMEAAEKKLLELYNSFVEEFEEKPGCLDRIPQQIKLVATVAAKDIHTAAEKIICRVFFPENPYIEKLLLEIDRIGLENPKEDINNVALYAFSSLITEWVVDQVQISR